MMRWVGIAFVLMSAGCPATVLRQRDTYVAELAFTDRMIRESAVSVQSFLLDRCACQDGTWRSTHDGTPDAVCRAQAEWWQVYSVRWSWHQSMMRYNARISDTRPGPPPVLPVNRCVLPDLPVR